MIKPKNKKFDESEELEQEQERIKKIKLNIDYKNAKTTYDGELGVLEYMQDQVIHLINTFVITDVVFDTDDYDDDFTREQLEYAKAILNELKDNARVFYDGINILSKNVNKMIKRSGKKY